MSNGKGDKWRGGWSPQYADNHNKIFGDKMSEITPEMYLSMYLSEQIPESEWQKILEWRTDIKELYQKHLESKNEK